MKPPSAPEPRKRRPKPAVAQGVPAAGDAPVGQGEPFPVVGIGASAGGLEAIEAFFRALPQVTGNAYVVVQHLDPTHETMLATLIGRVTDMPVAQAEQGEVLAPDHVYVIPPGADLGMTAGRLRLSEPAAPRGLRLPIDSFFRALAAERGAQSVGIVLSGMGSDGSLGLRAIREAGGLTLVQDPASAKFDSMPRSALESATADVVGAPAELAGQLLSILHYSGAGSSGVGEPGGSTEAALGRAVALLRSRTGHDFSAYKKSTAYRRIERRMAIHQMPRIDAYVDYLGGNPQEVDLLFKELLIGVTSFFRDPVAWDVLENQALPALFEAHPEGAALRAWVVGCSTGEEAYSLAIAFRETLERIKPKVPFSLSIFATDLHDDAIAKARTGMFPTNIAADLSLERLGRYFTETESGYRVGKEIRQMVTFAPQDVILDPPFTKIDLLTCRNLLIYFEPELQKRLMAVFHFSLNPGGVLFLGSAETAGTASGKFQAFDRRARVFRRLGGVEKASPAAFPQRPEARLPSPPEGPVAAAPRNTLAAMANQVLLDRFAPAAVLVGHLGDVVYINGRTGRYLEPAAGKANWNVHAMARPGLRSELAAALHKATRDKADVVIGPLRINDEAGGHLTRVVVHYIDQPESMRSMLMIVFTDLPEPEAAPRRALGSSRVGKLEGLLQEANEESRSRREEMQTVQEELKSSNEELQSTNEELQSTNEEMTTSKEELQSTNEELQMVNHELNARLDELSWASNDMANLLNGTGLAAIFLTGEFNVRRFTTHATRFFKLIPGDVGRALSDIVTDLVDVDLIAGAGDVLRTLVVSEREVRTRDGRTFWVRIIPYRIADHTIDGVVVTFAEVTANQRPDLVPRK